MNYQKFRNFYRKYISDNKYIYYPLVYLLAFIGYLFLKFVILTSRITCKKPDINFKKGSYIATFWHGRLISALILRKYFTNAYVLISPSRSALIIKIICSLFKVKVIEGSSREKGTESIKRILKILKQKDTVFAIAPDGPIGPRMRCSYGVANISILSETKIIPVGFSAKKSKFLNSWDRLMIPLPFNKIHAYIDTPIDYQENNEAKSIESLRLDIENKLNYKLWELDQQFNHEKITPQNTDRKGSKLKTKRNND